VTPGDPLAYVLLGYVPAKLAARVRLFDTGHNRKTDLLTELIGIAAGHGDTQPQERRSRSCECVAPEAVAKIQALQNADMPS